MPNMRWHLTLSAPGRGEIVGEFVFQMGVDGSAMVRKS